MHSDRDFELAAQQLAKFCVDGEAYHKAQAEILEKYATLMEDFKRLKSDYEEERDLRERYKQLAKGQERNPFVLVLVDGDGMVFDDEFISGGAEGGSLAAQRLNDAIKKSLRTRGLDHCRIMVRIYANLAGLSKVLSKAKLCGNDKRSLSPFVANFNRSNDLFDFVDAGEPKENADFKIRAMFRQFADNAQCKHIYFAACHDVGYISELTPFINNRDRITLIRTHASHHEFAKLGLNMEELPNIFRDTHLPTDPQQTYQCPRPISRPPHTPHSHASSSFVDQGTEKICHFFTIGMCKYGSACKLMHAKPSNNTNYKSTSLSNTGTWRGENKPGVPISSSYDLMSDAGQQDPAFEALLPKADEIPINHIPLNKNQQRLDSYMPRNSSADHIAFVSRVGHGKLCNNFHLKGDCPKGNVCEYDHNPISDGIRNELLIVARHTPCTRRGGCRLLDCTNSHICQKLGCRYRGGRAYCKLPAAMHSIDLNVSTFVPGTKGFSKDTNDNENEGTNGKGFSWEEPGTSESDIDSVDVNRTIEPRNREEDFSSAD